MPSDATDEVIAFCERVARAFMTGDLRGIAEFYSYPLAIYLPDSMRVELTAEDTRRVVFERRTTLLRSGVTDIRVDVAEMTDPAADRFSVRLAWIFLRATGAPAARSDLRYFCERGRNGAIRIALVEFAQLAFANAPAKWMSDGTAH